MMEEPGEEDLVPVILRFWSYENTDDPMRR